MAQEAPNGFTGLEYPCDNGILCIWCPPNGPLLPNTGFEEAVEKVLHNIRKKDSGYLITEYVAGQAHTTMIVPRPEGKETGSEALNTLDAFPAGFRERLCADTGYRRPGAKRLLRKFTGTGAGAHVRIYFTPKEHMGRQAPGSVQDEVLLHELVHAYRKLTATQTCLRWGHKMDTVEEVLAIALTNVYAGEWHRPLRNDHSGFTRMGDQAEWIRNMKPVLQDFVKQNTDFTNELARLAPATFNPFRALRS